MNFKSVFFLILSLFFSFTASSEELPDLALCQMANPLYRTPSNSLKNNISLALKKMLERFKESCPRETAAIDMGLSMLSIEELTPTSLLSAIKTLVRNPSCSNRYTVTFRAANESDISFSGHLLNYYLEKRFGGINGEFYRVYRLDLYKIAQWRNLTELNDEVLAELKRPLQGLMQGLGMMPNDQLLCVDEFCSYCQKQGIVRDECGHSEHLNENSNNVCYSKG